MGSNNFLTVPEDFWMPIFFSNFIFIFSNLLDLRNLQEQVKKAFCYQTLFWQFTVWINCSFDLKIFANLKSFSWSQFFLTVGQNNFGNKIPILSSQEPWIDALQLTKQLFSKWEKILDLCNEITSKLFLMAYSDLQ